MQKRGGGETWLVDFLLFCSERVAGVRLKLEKFVNISSIGKIRKVGHRIISNNQ